MKIRTIKFTKILFIVFWCVFFLLLSLFIYNCYSIFAYRNNNPFAQKSTTWVSENEKIVFTVPEEGSGIGTLKTDTGKTLNVIIVFFIGDTRLEVWPESAREEKFPDDALLEKWSGKFYGKDEFVVVVKETTYFTEGEKITFIKKPNAGDGSLTSYMS